MNLKNLSSMLHLKHFSNDELRLVTHPDAGDFRSDVQSYYSSTLLSMLDELREKSSCPVLLTSGYRGRDYNLAHGGVKDSAHTKGLAMDISCSDTSHRLLYLRAAIAVGFTRIGIGKTFLHLDIDTSKPQNVIWLY